MTIGKFPYTAQQVKEYREKHELGMYEAKRMMMEEYYNQKRKELHVIIKHAEIGNDVGMIIHALKILAEKY